MQVGAEVLYNVFRHSYSNSAEERQQAEAHIAAAEGSAGFLSALLQISVEGQAELPIRQAAAIQLKNQVRKSWATIDGARYAEAEKAAIRAGLVDAIAAAFTAAGVRAQLLECFRLVAVHDFPEQWPGLQDRILVGLKSDDTVQTYCALSVLRKLFKQLQMRPAERRGDLDDLCTNTFPALQTLGPALLRMGAQPSQHCLEALEMLKVVLKCYYSASYRALGEHLQQDVDAWMQLLLGVTELQAPLALLPADAEGRESSPYAKCRKWVFHIFFRFILRHGVARDGGRRRGADGTEEFAHSWSAKFAVPVTQASLREACAGVQQQPGTWVPQRSINIALLCLGEACSRSVHYEVMRPALQQLLNLGIFPWVCFRECDMRTWQEDPEELVRQLYNEDDSFTQSRVAALELVEKLLEWQSAEVFTPLLQFCHLHLQAHSQNPTDPELCSKKDGALSILCAMSERILRQDPARADRKKKGKRKPTTGGGISVEELLTNYVRSDFSSTVAFLRLRACWCYEKFVEEAQLKTAGAAAGACEDCLRLLEDPELPVRVAASTAIRCFIKREEENDECRNVIAKHLAALVSRLLVIMSQVQCEEVGFTLEDLVASFPKEIVPFAAQLVQQLTAQFCQVSTSADEEDDCSAGVAMSSLQTIASVLQSCGGIEDPKSRGETFLQVAEPLLPVLQRLFRPDGMDFIEDAALILTLLTFHGPSPIPAPIWNLFPQLYQSICGGATASLPLPEPLKDGYAVDVMPALLPPLENYMSRGPPEVFMSGTWAEAGIAYPEMVFNMCKKMVGLEGAGMEEDCSAGAHLAVAFFTAIPCPAADAWLPRYFDELWRRLPSAQTDSLRVAVLAAFAAMMWYNAAGFLQCTEARGCTQQVFEAWMRFIALAKKLQTRKVMLLGLLRIFQLSCVQQGLPQTLTAGIPHLVRQLTEQTREIIKLRRRSADSEDADSDGDDGDDSDNEQMDQILNKLRTTPDTGEDVDDDDDDDEFLGGSGGMDMPMRSSGLDNVDELAALSQALQQAPPAIQQQVDGWLGAGVLAQWITELDGECMRAEAARKAATPAMMGC